MTQPLPPTPEEILEEWEERAGIFQADAGDVYQSRAQAEAAAWLLMREKHGKYLTARAMAQSLKRKR